MRKPILLFFIFTLLSCAGKSSSEEEEFDITDLLLLNMIGGGSGSSASTISVTGMSPSVVTGGSTLTIMGTNLPTSSVTFVTTCSASVPTKVTVDVLPGSTSSSIKITVPTSSSGFQFCILTSPENTMATFTKSYSDYISSLSFSSTFFPAEQNVTAVSTSVMTNMKGSSVQYSISSGTLPAGLTLNSSSGTISGTPTALTSNAVVPLTISGVLNNEANAIVKNTTPIYALVVTSAQRTTRTCNNTGGNGCATSGINWTCTPSASCYSTQSRCQQDTTCGF